MHRTLDQILTWVRYTGTAFLRRHRDDRLIARYRAADPDAVFTIVGSGGTVNDLTEQDFRRIEAGTCAAINMAGMAPIAFDIYSIEAISDQHQADSLAAKVAGQGRPSIFWFQDRSKHDSAPIRSLTTRFPTHAYARVSVSVRRRLDSYRHVFRSVMRDRVFDRPNLNVNFALTGSVARLVLLACALGYRRIAFVGVDLGTTRYFWQEQPVLRGQPAWQDIHGAFAPNPNAASFQGAGGRVVPNMFEFLRSLHEDAGVDLHFSTIDPKGRSALTAFLRDDLYGPAR